MKNPPFDSLVWGSLRLAPTSVVLWSKQRTTTTLQPVQYGPDSLSVFANSVYKNSDALWTYQAVAV